MLANDQRLQDSYRVDAARAHLLERAGKHAEAIPLYRDAADKTTNSAERAYLLVRAAKLAESPD